MLVFVLDFVDFWDIASEDILRLLIANEGWSYNLFSVGAAALE